MIITTRIRPSIFFTYLIVTVLLRIGIAGANTNSALINDDLNIDKGASVTHIISGSLTLPQPNDYTSETLFILNLCSNGGNLNPSGCLYSSVVVIPKGDTTGSFSMEVSAEQDTNWDLSYNCFDCAAPFLRNGYYDGSGETTWDRENRALLASGEDHNNINIVPQTGSVISGTIRVPEDVDTENDYLLIDLFTKTEDVPFLDCCLLNSIQIYPGMKSVEYSIAVPPTSSLKWHIEYNCFYGLACESAVVNSSGYYSLNSPMTTTQTFSRRSLLTGGIEHQGIDLTLLAVDSKGKSLAPIIMLLLLDP